MPETIYYRKDGASKVIVTHIAEDIHTKEEIVIYRDEEGFLKCKFSDDFFSKFQQTEPLRSFFKNREELDALWNMEQFRPDYSRPTKCYSWERNIKRALKAWTILPEGILLYRTTQSIYAVREIVFLGSKFYWMMRFPTEEKYRCRLSAFSYMCSVNKPWLSETDQKNKYLPLLPN